MTTDISRVAKLPVQGILSDGAVNAAGQHWLSELTKLPAAIAEVSEGKETLGQSGINSQTGTTYTLSVEDAGKIVEFANASPVTVTIPPFADQPFAYPAQDGLGARIDIVASGAGAVTIAAGSGVTLRSAGSATSLRTQWSAATLYQRTLNEWVLAGDIA